MHASGTLERARPRLDSWSLGEMAHFLVRPAQHKNQCGSGLARIKQNAEPVSGLYLGWIDCLAAYSAWASLQTAPPLLQKRELDKTAP
jgi:hypothetical protein